LVFFPKIYSMILRANRQWHVTTIITYLLCEFANALGDYERSASALHLTIVFSIVLLRKG
jgi:hypothetical protein